MYRNNFDTSSSGVNIEFAGSYDTWLGQQEFDENFSRIRDNNRHTAIFFYDDWGNIKSPESIGEVCTIKKGTKKADILDLDYFYNESFSDIKRELLGKPLKDFTDFEDILTLRKGFETIETRGYCQGDCAIVLIDTNALKKCWGKQPDIKELSEEIDHLFWDSPISARVTINSIEFNYDEYDLDRYDWQREEFAELVAKDSGVDKQTLLAILPEHLKHE